MTIESELRDKVGELVSRVRELVSVVECQNELLVHLDDLAQEEPRLERILSQITDTTVMIRRAIYGDERTPTTPYALHVLVSGILGLMLDIDDAD